MNLSKMTMEVEFIEYVQHQVKDRVSGYMI